MPRQYKRKTDRGQVNHDAMLDALREVLSGRSVRDVANERGISKSSLHRKCAQYLKSENPEQERFDTNFKKALIFTDKQEKLIASFLERSSLMFYGLSTQEARQLAYETAEMNHLRMPDSWKETCSAGKDWLWGFLRRNPRLSIRTPEATSIARATAFNKSNVESFFDLLETSIKSTNASGFSIFNLDETGFTTVQRQTRVLAPKGHKQVGQITSAERGVLVTTCCIVSASGTALPPVFVFPRKNFKGFMLHGSPEGSLGLAHPSGWMTKENFMKVIQHFVVHAKPTREKPCLLIMDNHESHICLKALEKAKENNVHILTLPPHTSNKTQPLDRSVFGPMKAYFNGAANSWMLRNPGKPISIYNMAEIIGCAWTQTATPRNIQSGFIASGIWPYNRNIFSDIDYLPSSVSDRPYLQPSSASVQTASFQSETPQPSPAPSLTPSSIISSPTSPRPSGITTVAPSGPLGVTALASAPRPSGLTAPTPIPGPSGVTAFAPSPVSSGLTGPTPSPGPSGIIAVAPSGPSGITVPAPSPGPSGLTAPIPSPGPSGLTAPTPSPGPSGITVPAPSPGPSGLTAPTPSPGPSGVVPFTLSPGPSGLTAPTPSPGPSGVDPFTLSPRPSCDATPIAPHIAGFTSPEMFRGYPKAQPRKQSNRGRKRGKAMVATSTPEMKRIAAEEAARNVKASAKIKKTLFVDDSSDSDMDFEITPMDTRSSESEFEDDCVVLHDVKRVDVDDFVLCEFLGKKEGNATYYVAKVVERADSDGDIAVQFYKRHANTQAFQVSPEDVSLFPLSSVKSVLPIPKPQGTTSRTKDLMVFKTNFLGLKINKAVDNLLSNGVDTVGVHLGTMMLITRDLHLIREILVKQFNNFPDRTNFIRTRSHISRGLFFLQGATWKRMRHILSPSFSTSRMKQMNPYIESSAQKLAMVLEACAKEDRLLEAKYTLGQYTSGIIAKTGFGLATDCLGEHDNEFTMHCKSLVKVRGSFGRLLQMILFRVPSLHRFLIQVQ
ncbi:tigger transposable element-derived protein [Plakobranchus ocellatus]|uniref:Tigger transposable element-derived protein n=1 Tax=Plakobranchus ocellatus TaxID=259542 RepID=A0AAV4A412_9GAST|nr:tigger transposable element-derived protein [Plakobranchus ocellatus]